MTPVIVVENNILQRLFVERNMGLKSLPLGPGSVDRVDFCAVDVINEQIYLRSESDRSSRGRLRVNRL